jgi:hypothetical protein
MAFLLPVVGPTISAFNAIRSVRSFYRFLQGGRCVILDRRHLSHPREIGTANSRCWAPCES